MSLRHPELDEEQGDPRLSCFSKKRYQTQSFAEQLAQRQSAMAGHTIRTYACRYCGGWHIGGRRFGPNEKETTDVPTPDSTH